MEWAEDFLVNTKSKVADKNFWNCRLSVLFVVFVLPFVGTLLFYLRIICRIRQTYADLKGLAAQVGCPNVIYTLLRHTMIFGDSQRWLPSWRDFSTVLWQTVLYSNSMSKVRVWDWGRKSKRLKENKRLLPALNKLWGLARFAKFSFLFSLLCASAIYLTKGTLFQCLAT